jgi:hypothetical protein
LDIIRRLHNFVQSAMALVDHSRNLYNKLYLDTGRFPDYQARVNQDFAKDPLSKFVQDLRRYCHHYKAPNLSIRVTVTQEDGKQIEKKTVELLVEDLNTFPDWTSLAKKYLSSLDEAVNILEVATVYRNKVLRFYEWFQSRQTEIHAEEFERHREKQRQIFLLMLERKIDGCLENKVNMPFRKEEIFQEIFTANEFEKLEKIDSKSPERAKLAIELAENYFLLPDKIKQKIIRLYQEPGFFVERHFENGETSEA